MRRHVSAEVLALHREGAVSARKAGRIAAHLSACSQCADADSDLAAVPGILAAVQIPPMPGAIAERLQLAIATEAAARTADAAPGTAPAGRLTDATASGLTAAGADAGAEADSWPDDGTAAPKSRRIPGRADLPEGARRRSWRPRMPDWSSPLVVRGLAAAGAVVLIAGAGLLFANSQPTQETSAGSGTGLPAVRSPARQPAAPSPAVTGAGAPRGRYSSVSGLSLDYRLNGKIATARALNTHRNYTKQNMAPLVRKDVASTASLGKGVSASRPPAAPVTVFAGIRVLTLTGCLTKVAAGRMVVVADVARYLGQPATVVVLRPSADSHVLDVVVVGLTCSLAAPEIIAELTVPAG